MKIIECVQGDDIWTECRLGLPTASEFSRIVTPLGALSKSANKYAYRLIAETLLKRPMESLEGLEWIEWGKMNEADAVKMYEFQNEIETVKVGFITTDDGQIGCSPDRLVGNDGILEVKCPAPQTMVGYMINGMDKDYIPQVQGQLYVSEREWADWWGYNPEFPPVKVRTFRDEDYIKILSESLKNFVDMKAEMLEKIRKQGYFVNPTP